jgi:hypothetical protein
VGVSAFFGVKDEAIELVRCRLLEPLQGGIKVTDGQVCNLSL